MNENPFLEGLREYFQSDADGSRPSKKGVSIPTVEIPALRNAVELLIQATEVGTIATLNRNARSETQKLYMLSRRW